MKTTSLANYAKTPDDVKLWSRLSLEESRIRREHAHVRVRTVLLISGFALAFYVSIVHAMTP